MSLDQISLDRERNVLTLGADVTHQMLMEGAGDLPDTPLFDILRTTAGVMSALTTPSQATLASAIVTADSASPLVTCLLACDAQLTVYADEPRSMPLGGFLAYRERIMDEGRRISEIRLPIASPDVRFAYESTAGAPDNYPVVCAVVRCAVKDGILGSVRIGLGGVAATPIRLTALEFGLEKKSLASFLDRELPPAIAALNPPSDWLGSAEYRREMAGLLTRRAILRAASE
ncbi:MAG: FAD binding domain-containing protein [Candidatus Roseilinea sp.]|uniref:FAD binding domain-containing protein n=1 Tax=Candidatus Roseilinea sp. TaxID=2838777 RepID=UPI0040491F98